MKIYSAMKITVNFDIAAPLLYEDSVSRVLGEYVVVFKENVTDDEG